MCWFQFDLVEFSMFSHGVISCITAIDFLAFLGLPVYTISNMSEFINLSLHLQECHYALFRVQLSYTSWDLWIEMPFSWILVCNLAHSGPPLPMLVSIVLSVDHYRCVHPLVLLVGRLVSLRPDHLDTYIFGSLCGNGTYPKCTSFWSAYEFPL